MSLAEEIRRLRDAAGLTQHALAEQAGVSRTFIAGLEQGQRERMGADVLFRLADALKVKADHFRPFMSDTQAEDPPEEPERARGKWK